MSRTGIAGFRSSISTHEVNECEDVIGDVLGSEETEGFPVKDCVTLNFEDDRVSTWDRVQQDEFREIGGSSSASFSGGRWNLSNRD